MHQCLGLGSRFSYTFSPLGQSSGPVLVVAVQIQCCLIGCLVAYAWIQITFRGVQCTGMYAAHDTEINIVTVAMHCAYLCMYIRYSNLQAKLAKLYSLDIMCLSMTQCCWHASPPTPTTPCLKPPSLLRSLAFSLAVSPDNFLSWCM